MTRSLVHSLLEICLPLSYIMEVFGIHVYVLPLQLPEILNLCAWKWEYDCVFVIHNMTEWTLSSRIVYVAYTKSLQATVS
jgi:hypothetical protein